MTNQPALWNRNFVAVCLGNFFIFLTFYSLAVSLPVFVTDTLHEGEGRIGMVMTVFIIASILFRVLAGRWLDQYDRKKLITGAILVFFVCSALYLVVHSYTALLVLRFIHGMGFGLAATAAGAIAADLVPDERKGEGIGYFSLFMSLAMVIGPFVALTVIHELGDAAFFITCTICSLFGLLSVWVLRVPPLAKRTGPPAIGWRRYIELKALPISLAGCLLAFAYGSLTTFLSVYAGDLGFPKMGSYFFMILALMILVSRPFTGRAFDRWGEHVLVYPGILLFVLGMLLLSQVHSAGLLLVSGAILGLGFGALLPSLQTLAVQAAPPHRRGVGTSTFFVLFDVGYGIGAYVLGVVAEEAGYAWMYAVGGLVSATMVIVYYVMHHRAKRTAALPLESSVHS